MIMSSVMIHNAEFKSVECFLQMREREICVGKCPFLLPVVYFVVKNTRQKS
jgi:hypothetical protein